MLLLRGATIFARNGSARRLVSIHAPLARSNNNFESFCFNIFSFQYMLLLRGATRWIGMRIELTESFNTCSSCEEQLYLFRRLSDDLLFQYMLLLRGATAVLFRKHRLRHVSIHAPLARSNLPNRKKCTVSRVSIHAPLARSNCKTRGNPVFRDWFQYMLLLRGATPNNSLFKATGEFQYMLLLRGATLSPRSQTRRPPVSIHAPLARSNKESGYMGMSMKVSIHAPLARSN